MIGRASLLAGALLALTGSDVRAQAGAQAPAQPPAKTPAKAPAQRPGVGADAVGRRDPGGDREVARRAGALRRPRPRLLEPQRAGQGARRLRARGGRRTALRRGAQLARRRPDGEGRPARRDCRAAQGHRARSETRTRAHEPRRGAGPQRRLPRSRPGVPHGACARTEQPRRAHEPGDGAARERRRRGARCRTCAASPTPIRRTPGCATSSARRCARAGTSPRPPPPSRRRWPSIPSCARLTTRWARSSSSSRRAHGGPLPQVRPRVQVRRRPPGSGRRTPFRAATRRRRARSLPTRFDSTPATPRRTSSSARCSAGKAT